MSCFSWLNLELEEDIFFIEELKEIRDRILEKREEDITAQLYIYQGRIFTYSENTISILK